MKPRPMKPRRRFFSAIVSGVSALVVLGGSMHYLATRRQRLSLLRRIEESDRRISLLEKSLASKQNRSAVEGLSAEGNEPRSGESVWGYRQGYVCRPRFLGSGQFGKWIYLDVCHGNGEVLRYYCRKNPSRSEVRHFVRTLADDAQSRAYSIPVD